MSFLNGKRVNILKVFSGMFFGCAVFLVVIAGALFAGTIYAQSSKGTDADGFNINSFDVTLDVAEDGSVDVEELVGIHFYEYGHHGIYRFIPQWLKYTGKDGKTTSRKSVVTDLDCENYPCSVDTVKGKKRIKIGSAYQTLEVGDYTYDITYNYDMGADPFKGYDEFIFHVYGDFWGTRIKKPTVTINLPKDFDSNGTIHFFADKKRKVDITKRVDYTVEGNTIKATVSPSYDLEGSLTVDVELPEGYFQGGSNNYRNAGLYCYIFVLVITLICGILWFFFGKDYKKFPETVEFYPPCDLDAAQMGYIYKASGGRKLATALIVELAAKGYVKIDKPEDMKELTVNKVQEPKESTSKLTKNEKLVYKKLFLKGDSNVLSTDEIFYEVFDQINKSVKEEFQDTINEVKSYKVQVLSSALIFIAGLAWIVAWVAEDMNPAYQLIMILSFAGLILGMIFDRLMTRKSKYGEEVLAKIRGFRNYLETAEKDKINMLAEENPNYFYDILPYAYVLDVSGKWISHFQIPEAQMDEYVGMFDNIYSSSYYAIESTRSSSSGGCSSCGGGCSSCGGGCSSCGGGGSW